MHQNVALCGNGLIMKKIFEKNVFNPVQSDVVVDLYIFKEFTEDKVKFTLVMEFINKRVGNIFGNGEKMARFIFSFAPFFPRQKVFEYVVSKASFTVCV